MVARLIPVQWHDFSVFQIGAVPEKELGGVGVDEDPSGGVRGPPQDRLPLGRSEGQGEAGAGMMKFNRHEKDIFDPVPNYV